MASCKGQPLNQFCVHGIYSHGIFWNIWNISEQVMEYIPNIPGFPSKFHPFLTKVIVSFGTKGMEYILIPGICGILGILWNMWNI